MSYLSLPVLAKALPFLLAAGLVSARTQTPTPPPAAAAAAGSAAGSVAGSAAGAAAKVLGSVAGQAVKAVEKVIDPKAQAEKLVDKILAPKISEFTLGGFQITQVEGVKDALPANFSGKGRLELPAPLAALEVAFEHLVITGNVAKGAAQGTYPGGRAADHQGWHYALSGVAITDQGGHATGTLAIGRLKVLLASAPLTPAGFSGSVPLGDLPLAEGPFTATVLGAELVLSPEAPVLKGTLKVVMDTPFRNLDTGAPVEASCPVAFDGAIFADTGNFATALAANLAIEARGLVYQLDKLFLTFERGVPVLRGPARLGFPLQTFCQASSTGQPYLSDPSTVALRATAPTTQLVRPATTAMMAVHTTAAETQATAAQTARAMPSVIADPRGFTGTFPLPGATLLPSGLTSYHLKVDSGRAEVKEGRLDTDGTRLTGSVAWGPDWTALVEFKDAAADLADGLYLVKGYLKGEVPVGAYGVQSSLYHVVCDFSSRLSPEGMAPEWKGLFLPCYTLVLPEELFRLSSTYERHTVHTTALKGYFEANGAFSGRVGVKLTDEVVLFCMPMKLDPFELEFGSGAVLDAPRVTGTTNLDQAPILEKFYLPVAFDLTQTGAQKIQITTSTPSGDRALATELTGVSIVLSEATLHPTNLDLSGRFDFSLEGANLPSIPFTHMVLEATGGGIEGTKGDIAFNMAGALWSELPGHPRVGLWGFGYGLQEDGFGQTSIPRDDNPKLSDTRFFVGFGGEMDINPVLPPIYNRVLFTTGDDGKGAVKLEKTFSIDANLASMGSVKGNLDFKVETAGGHVSTAYMEGDGSVMANLGDGAFSLTANLLFGHNVMPQAFPYFALIGHLDLGPAAIKVASDVEIYGLTGGIAQNFQPDDLDASPITGKPDSAIGMALIAGADVGSSDQFTFHGDLDVLVSQNLTVLIQGDAFLLSGRDASPPGRRVSADISLTRNPTTFHAVLDADLDLCDGLLRSVGTVELLFDPSTQFVHVGTPEAPVSASFLGGGYGGTSFYDVDHANGMWSYRAGGGFSMDTGNMDFGIVWGRAYLNAWGDMVIYIDENANPGFQGVMGIQGGASFGMKFKTFWHTYRLTIFSGDISANMAFQAPGKPTLAGHIDVHYSVLGGMFSGTAGVNMEF